MRYKNYRRSLLAPKRKRTNVRFAPVSGDLPHFSGQSQHSECAGSLSPLINKKKVSDADMAFQDASTNTSKEGP